MVFTKIISVMCVARTSPFVKKSGATPMTFPPKASEAFAAAPIRPMEPPP